MKHSETALLLAMCAAYDQRTIGETDVSAWQAALHDIDLGDARAAVVAWYQRTRDRIAVSDVRGGVRQLRTARLQHVGAGLEEAVPDADPDDVDAYLAALRVGRLRLVEGDQPRRPVLIDGVFRRLPSGRDAS